jgi:DNA-binding transcriptional regulator YiaG
MKLDPIKLMRIRASQGITKADLSRRIGVKVGAVKRWEVEGHQPKEERMIELLAKELGVGVKEICVEGIM